MTDLITWLRAQLDTDERIALSATAGPWRVDNESFAETIYAADDTNVVAGGRWNGEASVFDTTQDALHIAAHDPARALRQVQAHRAILDDYERALERRRQHPEDVASAADLLSMLRTAKRLLPIYSDRDGYREEWSA